VAGVRRELGVAHAHGRHAARRRDRDEAEALDREHAFRTRQGLRAERLLPSAARRLEPALRPTVRLALEGARRPRRRSPRGRRRAAACRAAAGAELREGAEVTDVPRPPGGLRGRRRRRLVAALADVAVRPVKGQILRLRDPEHRDAAPLLARVLRFAGGYLVPRGDGRYVLGATMEERGFDTTVTAGGLFGLLEQATELVPGIGELVVEETLAGLRPGSPANLPIVERRGDVVVATGHFRNGVLLAPVTADRVLALLEPVAA
jgi:glycine oxidase